MPSPRVGTPPVLFVSLGNPRSYHGTRHSVGHLVLLLVGHMWGCTFERRHGAEVAQHTFPDAGKVEAVLAMSTGTFMNTQGPAVAKVWGVHKGPLVLLHDELEKPLGKVQIRRKGTSARGHNGLRSVSATLGHNYTKIGIGIAAPFGCSVADFVLGKFTREEMDIVREVAPQVAAIMHDMAVGKVDVT